VGESARQRQIERERDRERKHGGGRANGRQGLGRQEAALFCIEVSARQPEIGRERKATPDKARCCTCRWDGARPSGARGGPR
jgi:hypothetical protein